MATSDDRWTVNKLSSDNYAVWKFQMKHLLITKGLYTIVDGSEAAPATSAEAGVKAEYQGRAQRALSILALSVSDELVYLISDAQSAKSVWDKLASHFERNTVANKLFLKKQYFRTIMDEGTVMSQHIKHMKELTDKLAAIQAPIAEEDQVVTLLGSLPSSYDNVVTALEARVDGLTLEFVHQSLLNEEQKRTDGNKSTDAALYSKSKPKKQKRCFICNSPEHLKPDCPDNRRFYNPSQQRNELTKHKAKHVSESSNEQTYDDAFTVNDECLSSQSQSIISPWIIDSGASRHMTMNQTLFSEYQEFTTPEKVSVGDGRLLDAIGSGKVLVDLSLGRRNKTIKKFAFRDVLYVPDLAVNLFSVRAVTDKGFIVQFGKNRCWIKDSKRTVRAMGTLVGRMFHLDCESVVSIAAVTSDIWHQRLGHLNESTLAQISKDDRNDVQINNKLSFCEGCIEGKMSRNPHHSLGEIRSTRRLELVHSDVCTMDTKSIGGSKYFVTFIDDFSRCCAVYFLKHKSEVMDKFKAYQARVASSGEKIGTLKSDQGGEYLSQQFKDYLTAQGIHHEFSAAYTPQQNGVAERMNRTLCESARSMLFHAGLDKKFWAEAINTAAYLRNRIPTTSHGTTPYEKWHNRSPSLDHLRVFGCTAYAFIPEQFRTKLDKKCDKMIFVGYSVKSKAYRLYDKLTNKVLERSDVTFNENEFQNITQLRAGNTTVEIEANQDANTDLSSSTDSSLRRVSTRSTKSVPPTRYGIDEYAQHVAYRVYNIEEPTTLKEATNSQQALQWTEAANVEYESLIENHTWDLVELPKDRKPVGCKWIFKAKYKDDGEIERFKARLVAQGYAQKPGIDFHETFSPVVKHSSIRSLLSYGVNRDMKIHQMDVVTAFLNGNLDEEIYMHQPEGFVQKGQENLVCRLRKSIYGLKQSPRCWNTVLDSYLQELDFKRSEADQCVYIQNCNGKTRIVAVYVDDMIIMTDTDDDMSEIKRKFEEKFKMKDMGELHYCLGITVQRGDNSLQLYQKYYLQKVLARFGMLEANAVSTPADSNVKLQKDDGVSTPVDSMKYQSMVGSLLYAASGTRPDISQAVGDVSKYSSHPTESHLTAVKRIMRYLKGTIDLKLTYKKCDNQIVGFADANWAGDLDNRTSTSGNIFISGTGAVSWLSKGQTVVATSTAEAEYISLYHCVQEAIVLNRLSRELNQQHNTVLPMTIYCDSQSAISIAKNINKQSRAKHIDIKYHFVRQAVANKQVSLEYCDSQNMVADMLTKPLPREQFEKLRSKMGLIS